MAKKNYNLLIGVMALVGIILAVSIIGYFVSRPKDIVIQGPKPPNTAYRARFPAVSRNSAPRKETQSAREIRWLSSTLRKSAPR